MTLFALLVKELRLRMRRETTIWLLVLYVVTMGGIAWVSMMNANGDSNYGGSAFLYSTGIQIYHLLIMAQLGLIIFIVPAFTANAINVEKERQTYDLLRCSRLTSFSLVLGKLIAGLSGILLLMLAALPLFSLIFFFGGVAPLQIVEDLAVIIMIALAIGAFSLLCSTVFSRPAQSTVVAYVLILLWISVPPLLTNLVLPSSASVLSIGTNSYYYYSPSNNSLAMYFFQHPRVAVLIQDSLLVISPFSLFNGNSFSGFKYYRVYNMPAIPTGGMIRAPYGGNPGGPVSPVIGPNIPLWLVSMGVSLVLALLFVLVSVFLIYWHNKKNPGWRKQRRTRVAQRHLPRPSQQETQSVTTA